MGRVKFRKVKEIYAYSVEAVQPKNTESEGNDGAGGHADAAEHAVESNEGLSVIGEQQNPSEEIHMRQKSWACDVCTSSCSCMLSERHASAAEGTNAHEASMVENSPHGSPVKAINELSHEIAVLSKRSDTPVVSSIKDPYIGSLPSPQSSGMLSTSNTLYNITPKTPASCISSEKPCLTSAELGKTSENEISSPQSKLSGLQNADEQLSAVDSLSKSVQPSGELHPSDILPMETKGGKRRAEIELDLLASCETNDKRWKSYMEVFQDNNSSRLSNEFKRFGSSSGMDRRLRRALTIGPVPPPPQAVSMKDKNVLEPEILNLELSLGAGKKKVAQETSSPSLGLVDNNKGKRSIDRTSNENDECLTSLTLSLALPVSVEQNKGKCSISRTSNESDECLTSLTLSLALPASKEQNKCWNNNKQ